MRRPDDLRERIEAHRAVSKAKPSASLNAEQSEEVIDAYIDGSPEAIRAVRIKYLPKDEV